MKQHDTKGAKEFLRTYTPEIREIALQARALVLEMMPEAIEQVDRPAKIIGYGFGRKMADMVCVIAPYTSHVNLGFSRGAQLPDPDGVLEGTGKNARHIKLRSPADVKKPVVRAMLKAAVELMAR